MIQFDEYICFKWVGWNHQLDENPWKSLVTQRPLRLVSFSLLGFFISVVAVPLLRLTVGSSIGAWCGHFRGTELLSRCAKCSGEVHNFVTVSWISPRFLLSFSFSVFFPCNVLSFFLSLLLVFVLALLGIFLAFLAPIPFSEKSSCHVPSLPFPLANFLDGLSGPRLEADLPPCWTPGVLREWRRKWRGEVGMLGVVGVDF